MTPETLVASLRTNQGRVRDHNEDFITSWEPDDGENGNARLYILADGAGGMHAGEVASATAAEVTLKHYQNDTDSTDQGKRLYEAMCAANEELRDLMIRENTQGRMATTMVATIVQENRATIANVGDSRGYLWRQGTLRQVTRDHSLVAKLVEEGAITEEEAVVHPRRNVILASLGSDSTPQVDLFEETLEPGDQLLLCSDGLTSHVSDMEIAVALATLEPDVATETLIQMANDGGGTDNISVVVLRYGPRVEVAEEAVRVEKAQLPPRPEPVTEPEPVGIVEDPLLEPALAGGAVATLWTYTLFLALAEAVLIFLVWLWINPFSGR